MPLSRGPQPPTCSSAASSCQVPVIAPIDSDHFMQSGRFSGKMTGEAEGIYDDYRLIDRNGKAGAAPSPENQSASRRCQWRTAERLLAHSPYRGSTGRTCLPPARSARPDGIYPTAFLVEQLPGSRLDAHFHDGDQFNSFSPKSRGVLGGKEVTQLTVQYTASALFSLWPDPRQR